MGKKEEEMTGSKDKYIAKKNILEAIVRKIDYYSSKNSTTDIELYYIVKEFFTQFLELKYEFSLDELILELDKVYLDSEQRNKTLAFINKIKIIEFEDSTFSQEKVKDLIREFSVIARTLAKINEPEKKGFWKKMGTFFVKDDEPKINNIDKRNIINKDTHLNEKIPPEGKNNKSLDSFTQKEFSESQDKLEDESITLPEFEGKYVQQGKETKTTKKNNLKSNEKANNSKIENKNIEKNYIDYRKNYESSTTNGEPRKYVASEDWTSDAKIIGKTSQKKNDKITAKDSEDKQSEKNTDNKTAIKLDEFNSLLDESKKINEKTKLTEIYKKIHDIYELADVDFQARYYNELMDIYKRISKLK
jgi:hypothetical protein